MGLKVCSVSILLFALLGIHGKANGAVTLLHEFAGGGEDGERPYDSLTLDGSTLYGITFWGGDDDEGTIFSVGTDGTGFTLVHEFVGGANDGSFSQGNVTLDGSTLYGATRTGGNGSAGTVFAVGTDGSGHRLLHEFSLTDGYLPRGSVTLDGSTLYGMTWGGGDGGLGTIFSVGTDGSGFTLLHEFVGLGNDGSRPHGSLTLDGSTLYGMTYLGGDSDEGTIFSIGTDGSGFTLLHEFAGGANDGSNPFGNLTLDGSILYGMTSTGGDSDEGTVFSMGTDGTGFSLLREFAGGGDDGRNPAGDLTLDGSTLYGMTSNGGDSDMGTIFSMETDGSGFSLMHEFAGGSDDGENPLSSSLTLDGTTLYGMTYLGGESNLGTIFAITVPEPSTLTLAGLGLLGLGFYGWRRRSRPQ